MEQKAKTLEERMEQKVEKLQRRLYQVECRRLACEDVLELQQKHAEDAEDERERPPNPDQKNIYKQRKSPAYFPQ